MKKSAALFAFLALTACTRNVAVVAPPENVNNDAAIRVAYVGAPEVTIRVFPTDTSSAITTFRYTETVSVLAEKGDWVKVRTILGNGWMHKADLVDAATVDAILKDPSPRFLAKPEPVPDARARGEIAYAARVNTDGEVIDFQTLRNTTGNKALADANGLALKNARFYPMLQKGQRVVFTYEHRVYY